MKDILGFIEQKKQEFARLPLFEFMQDTSIDPRTRLGWAPCAAFFIMSFGDLNKYIFRDETTSDPIQELINTHTHEDEHHSVWFLQDLEKLSFDDSLKFSDTLDFLWGEETQITRWVTHQLFGYAFGATPIQKLVIIEVLEATGNIVFTSASQVSMELERMSGQQCDYFGSFHLDVETGHTTGNQNIEEILFNIELKASQEQELLNLANQVFEVLFKLNYALLAYAQKNQSVFTSGKNHYDTDVVPVSSGL
ncbi:MAG: hypothetical protein WBB29_21320 [Geitlerinemataceae cyanobacterium]